MQKYMTVKQVVKQAKQPPALLCDPVEVSNFGPPNLIPTIAAIAFKKQMRNSYIHDSEDE